MRISNYLLAIIFLITNLLVRGQDLGEILNSNAEIKIKCEQLIKLSDRYRDKNKDSAIYVAKLADSISRKTNDYKFISQMLRHYSDVMAELKKDIALNLAYENLELCKKSKDCKLISRAYILIASTNYWRIGNVEKGFEFYKLAMAEAEKCNDKETLLEIYNNSQNIYFNNQKFEENKEILFKMEKVEPNLKQDAWHNADIGDIFRALDKLDSADLYYLKAVDIAQKKNDSLSLSQLYFNYALIPKMRKDFKTAIQYCKMGLEIVERLKDKNRSIHGNNQLYGIYQDAGDLVNAKKHLLIVIKLNEKRNCTQCLIGNYRRMSELSSELKNYQDAYTYLRKGIELFEDNNNAQTNSNITKIEEENLKKQKQLEIDLIHQQKEAEKRIKNISFIALAISFALILGIVFSLFKINKSKKLIVLQQIETERQKTLVEEKNKEVEEKQKEILDSIRYAKRIQTSLLPTDKYLNRILGDKENNT